MPPTRITATPTSCSRRWPRRSSQGIGRWLIGSWPTSRGGSTRRRGISTTRRRVSAPGLARQRRLALLDGSELERVAGADRDAGEDRGGGHGGGRYGIGGGGGPGVRGRPGLDLDQARPGAHRTARATDRAVLDRLTRHRDAHGRLEPPNR